jgi:hypothetical protein
MRTASMPISVRLSADAPSRSRVRPLLSEAAAVWAASLVVD